MVRVGQHLPPNITADGGTDRWRSSLPMLLAGSVWIIAGGLAAAVTGPTGWDEGSWVAAFLVLVAGVGQVGLGAGPALLASEPVTPRRSAVEAVLWNGGCLGVVAGTLVSKPAVVTFSSALLVAALVVAALAARGRSRWPALLGIYRLLLMALLVSIPIGIVLAWARA